MCDVIFVTPPNIRMHRWCSFKTVWHHYGKTVAASLSHQRATSHQGYLNQQCVFVCVHVCVYLCVFISVYMCVLSCLCVHRYLFICAHTLIDTSGSVPSSRWRLCSGTSPVYCPGAHRYLWVCTSVSVSSPPLLTDWMVKVSTSESYWPSPRCWRFSEGISSCCSIHWRSLSLSDPCSPLPVCSWYTPQSLCHPSISGCGETKSCI